MPNPVMLDLPVKLPRKDANLQAKVVQGKERLYQ